MNRDNKEYRFFNKDIKLEYLNKLEAEDINLYEKAVTIFNKICNVEKFNNKDVCNFNKLELIRLFENCKWSEYPTFSSKAINLKRYIDWCKENNIEISTDIYNFNFDDISADDIFETSYYKDYDSLIRTITYVFSLGDYPTEQIDMMLAVATLKWIGLDSEDMISLTRDNIHQDYIITESEKEYNITPDMYNLFMKVFSYTYCEYENAYDEFDRIITKYYQPTPYLLRCSYPSEEIAMEYTGTIDIYSFMKRKMMYWNKCLSKLKSDELGLKNKKLQMPAIKKSGMYYKLYQYEKTNPINGETISLEDFIKLFPYETKTYIRQKIVLNFFKSYKKWKKYFYNE